jgi:hypothetical protein
MRMESVGMKITLLDIQKVFTDVLNHRISREEAEEWAAIRMNALDNNELFFDPATKEDLLWEAVLYLSGIGLKIAPDKYMEDEIGIKEMFDTYWN